MDRLVNKSGGVRSEATIQSDVRMLLLDSDLGLRGVQLEAKVGDHHQRIDVEVGCTVIEVKKALSGNAAIAAARNQLTDYVVTRQAEMGLRYVGILTDGALWIAFHEVDGQLVEATRHVATAGATGRPPLVTWLEGVLATKTAVSPTPDEIQERLGAHSSSHALDFATLKALYDEHGQEPTVVLKRELWANLLKSALGTQFTNDDDLFLEHTLLVNSAEVIAHLVLGIDATELAPATLLSGDQFSAAGLYGVVDRDFFDWVLEVPGGEGFIRSLARRLSRFDWSAVEHDVLKVLYESVITTEVRKSLGEYYTPDWLANRVVQEVVTDPLNQRVLDPSCGSGTFVFYAVRRFLEAAEAAGMSLAESMNQVSSKVIGIDLHPVAVALARVTYLLALGRDRLTTEGRGTLSVPVYLGDSLGWQQSDDILSVDMLVIPTEVGDQFFSAPLRFPDHLLQDSARFDQIVEALVEESGRAKKTSTVQLSTGAVRRLGLAENDLPVLNENFTRLKQLHEDNRNHIWSYYVRNVARPAWLNRSENRVDVLVGNPPWLSYRHMTKEMQREFKTLSRAREFWHRENTATHQDLAGLFVAKAVERYLKAGGRLAFVVPNSVIDRDYWGGFRRGVFEGAGVRFAISWDLRRVRPHMFPRGSAVIFGQRADKAREMPPRAVVWRGKVPRRGVSSDYVTGLSQGLEDLRIGSDEDELSPYHSRFAQGANLVPRMMFRVEETVAGPLGAPGGKVSIKSKRSAAEKKPWKDLPAMTGSVERQFLWPTVLGEHILQFRLLPPDMFVLPLSGRGQVMKTDGDQISAFSGVDSWMRSADALWREHGDSRLTLTEQIDHMRKLTHQLPVPTVRVAYAASGMHLSAALVTDQRAVIEHGAYWATVSSVNEGHYLVGILNTPTLTELVRPLMSYGKDERHIDKAVWRLPIPAFDHSNPLHARIVEVAKALTSDLAEREWRSDYFVTIRQDVRAWMLGNESGRELDNLVRELLGEPPLDDNQRDAPQAAPAAAGLIRLTSSSLGIERADLEVDLDIEFDEARQVYLWGYLVSRSGSEESTYHSVGSAEADLDPEALARQLADELGALLQDANDAGQSVRLYHYGDVERLYLKRLLGGSADELLSVATDLLGVVRTHYFSGLGYSLKRLAPLTGFQWAEDGMSGADTYDLVARARKGDGAAWSTLLRYNEDDTRALRALRQHLY
jgi:type I restriction-modification system DNA methylase subunit